MTYMYMYNSYTTTKVLLVHDGGPPDFHGMGFFFGSFWKGLVRHTSANTGISNTSQSYSYIYSEHCSIYGMYT